MVGGNVIIKCNDCLSMSLFSSIYIHFPYNRLFISFNFFSTLCIGLHAYSKKLNDSKRSLEHSQSRCSSQISNHICEVIFLSTVLVFTVEYKGHCLLDACRIADPSRVKKFISSDVVNFKHPYTGNTPLVRYTQLFVGTV